MEILIIGLAVVALMVYASTKIKKKASLAFEPETIETENFKILKPKGLMTPLRENPPYLFEAYSKEYGAKKERNVWQTHAFLTVETGLKFKAECKKAKENAEKILSERVLNEPNGEKVFLLESEKSDNRIPVLEFRKIVESRRQKKTYDLKITVLRAFREEHIHQINDLTNSFRLK